jgi:hypothetical protein
MSAHPRFCRTRFNKHDPVAKEVVKSLMEQMGYIIVNEDECYSSHDFVAEKNSTFYKVEVEQKMGWKYDEFPYSTLSVSHRKHTSRADLFFEVNARGTAVMSCPMSVVLSSPVIRKNTCLGTIAEPFFDVPISTMRFFYFTDGVWTEEFM